ncbi:MAG: GTP 3',8-cyclase MoaA [Actinomycetota bacterium]|nr:GTP 3',8-cyclase MoaA [Actinomycetota bacterium]
MSSAPLIDPFGRRVRDLRISVTDRCNFRCDYCMPAEGMKWLPRDQVLTFEEIARVAAVCVGRFGFEGIRITGGEPTVRAHLPVLVGMLAELRTAEGQPVDLAMTTNGATLALLAEDLRRAGLRRLNISCDSLREDRFAAMTRRNQLGRVLEGIQAAKAAGYDQLKLNVVTVRGVNDDEAVDFATFGREQGVQPRFIEFMPLDAGGTWDRSKVVPASETVAAIDAVYPLQALPQGSAPAQRYRYRDGRGEVGAIASVTQPFCGSCDRIRLTAEGQLRTCLFSTTEHDLRAVLRDGSDDDRLAGAIAAAVGTKWAGHSIGRSTFVRPLRGMSQIGG